MDENASTSDLSRLLPTCQRCRRLRRKCDTQLPACRLCEKGKAECTFFDHALQQTLPRSYVSSLLTRLSRLKSVQRAVNGSGGGTSKEQQPYVPVESQNAPAHQLKREPSISDWTGSVSFDKHFVLLHGNPTCWQFFGSSSVYSLAVEVLVHAQARIGTITQAENYTGSQFWLDAQAPGELDAQRGRPTPDRTEIEMLVSLYLASTNTLMAFIDDEAVAQDVDAYLILRGMNARTLAGRDAHQFFRIGMICAIASANKARHQPAYASESIQYYYEALQCVEEVTSDVSAEALIALLLLSIFAIFYPRKGDVWKLLDFACRLSVELNYHQEPNDDFEEEKSRRRRRCIFWGLYCLERTVGQIFGRPSDLTEEIITAEYPAALDILSLTEPLRCQDMLMSHYYRLTYLRSEIFREVYLPANAPILPRFWYEQRLDHIIQWQRDLQGVETLIGMGSITCDVGFETSICFLFQPLLLRALVASKDESIQPDDQQVIPLESYQSACKVIEIYKKIFRAPETSPYGLYPLTINSAHFVHTAAMTIMAHCLLAIDGRIPVVTFLPDQSSMAQIIDFSTIYDISGSCLILLSRLAERWPGMVGMLDIYKNLSDKILPIVMRIGGE